MNVGNNFGLLYVLLSCVWTDTNAQFRIIGGHYIPIESSPHSVALLDNYRYFCVGAIVNFKSVLTAAHCVENRIWQNLAVLVGVTDLLEMNSGGGQQRYVDDIHYDCDYDPQTKSMDIAIVKVDTPFDLNRAVDIIPLCDVPLEPRLTMQISGWGMADANSETSSPLLKTKSVQIADTQLCRNAYATHTELQQYFAETIMYAGRSSEDMGFGDSGAAGVVNGRLCAVAQGFCSDPDYPALYTNVSNPKVRKFITTWM